MGSLESLLPPAAPTAGADGKAEDLALLPESLGDALWHDVGRHWAQWAVMVALATVYLSLQAFMPLPAGCPTGYTGAGGLADGGKYAGLGCTGGAHRAIDVAIFGLHHIYHVNIGDQVVSSATCSEDYLCVPSFIACCRGAFEWARWCIHATLTCEGCHLQRTIRQSNELPTTRPAAGVTCSTPRAHSASSPPRG